MGLANRTPPTREEFFDYRERFKNWGRWGADDQLGTLNHITPDVRRLAGSLIREGRTISLGHRLATRPSVRNQFPAVHYMRVMGNMCWDYFAVHYHGMANTHIDALCHIFTDEQDGYLYNGRPASDVSTRGARSNSVDHWRDGIVTRGVLYDVPRFRNTDFVALGEPVQGWELEDVARAQGVEPRPGDAVIVRSGAGPFFEALERGEVPAEASPGSSKLMPGSPRTPGLHASALEFLHEYSAALLVWDLGGGGSEAEYPTPGGGAIHYIAIPYMGLPLLDNADLEALATACGSLQRWEFMFMCAPLIISGGTGSPVNPLAVL